MLWGKRNKKKKKREKTDEMDLQLFLLVDVLCHDKYESYLSGCLQT